MAQTLTAGDLAIIGMNADNPDAFAFVLLTSVTSGTTVSFTDNGWLPAGGFRTGEGLITWTAPSDIAAGTMINFTTGDPAFTGTTLPSFSTDGDSLIAFQGTLAEPSLLYALTINANQFDEVVNNAQATAQPTGLVLGQTAIARGLDATNEYDNAIYTGPTTGSRAQLLAAIGDVANWQGANDALTMPTAAFTVSGSDVVALASLIVDQASRPEGETYTFTVTLSGAATADTVVTLASSGATADISGLPATVTVAAGQSTATFTVLSNEDNVFEPNEAFTVTASLGADTRDVVLTIENDEVPTSVDLGGITILAQAQSLAGSVEAPVATNSLNIYRTSDVPTGTGAGGAESITFDPETQQLFVTNAQLDLIDIYDLSDPTSVAVVDSIDLRATLAPFAYGEVNSVAVRNGVVAVAVQNADGGSNGIVALYNSTDGTLIKTIEVGVLPDQITFTADPADENGSLLLVANEAERFYDAAGGTPVVENAPGTITVVAIPADATAAAVRNTVGFGSLDSFKAELDALGIKTFNGTSLNVNGQPVAVDGYNLAMPQGTGVATYGSALAAVLGQMGHQVEGVFGLDPGSKPEMREVLFFDRFGHGHRLSEKEVARRAITSVAVNHLPRRLRSVPLTDRVDRRSFGFRLPAFDALWTNPLLFEKAYARFTGLRQFLTVSMPDPPDVMHWTYPVPLRMAGTRNVYTIHDLVPLKLPHTTLDNKRFYRRLVARCIREADHICTVSEASRSDILSLFDIAPDKVTNTYLSSQIPPELTPDSEARDFAIIRSMFGLEPKAFHLFFGALDPKKNIGRIVDAYLTSQSEVPLVIVSARDWGMNWETRMLGKNGRVYGRPMRKRVIRLEYLPRATLHRLIRAARSVLFPSLYEGFGLPALEAMQLGTPVITSNLSSLPEVVGDAGLLVDPYKVEEIAAAIRSIDTDHDLRDRLRDAGPAQAARFSDAAYRARLSAMYDRMGLRGDA